MGLASLLTQLEQSAKGAESQGEWIVDNTKQVICAKNPAGHELIGIAQVFTSESDANHIALCSPDTVLKLVSVVRELIRQRNELDKTGRKE